MVIGTQRHALLVAAFVEAHATALVALLEPIVANLGHAPDVAPVEEQASVPSVRLDVVDDVRLEFILLAVWALAIRMTTKLLASHALPAFGLIEVRARLATAPRTRASLQLMNSQKHRARIRRAAYPFDGSLAPLAKPYGFVAR